jgi:hypothetical protein
MERTPSAQVVQRLARLKVCAYESDFHHQFDLDMKRPTDFYLSNESIAYVLEASLCSLVSELSPDLVKISGNWQRRPR